MNSQLERSFHSLMKHNKEGSHATHSTRWQNLNTILKDVSKKFPLLKDVRDIKTRHVSYAVEKMKNDGLATGTIKNRMSTLRWTAEKIDKANIVYRTNDEYGIERRQYVDNEQNRAKELSDERMQNITNEYTQNSLRLQEAFGLRREEAMKIQPHLADNGDHIHLKDSWCKGGRERDVPIVNEHQREVLDSVKAFCERESSKSLIHPDKSYYQQKCIYEQQTYQSGETDNHGLRHAYAQSRYEALTGNQCPKLGGKTYRDMNEEERAIDHDARLKIAEELGHGREEVSAVYLGR